MSEYIPLSVPSLQGNEWKYLKECLDTEWVSSGGSFVSRFENEIKQFTGSKHAIACINGTSALHISLLISGVKPVDEVIVPTLTFIAPINTIRYLNANPLFMDCDNFYNIDVEKTVEFIKNETVFREGQTYNQKTGRKISAIIPVHIFGNAVDLKPLLSLCRDRNIRIIEDATESLGTRYTSEYLERRHSGTIGDLGCLSFNGNKIITTGGGGMILTDNPEYAKKARYLTTQAKDDQIQYIHNEIGYNYRLSNIQAALGVAQLEKLPEYLIRKRKNYNLYSELINTVQGLSMAEVPPYAINNYWMYALILNHDGYDFDVEKLMNYLGKNGIQTRPIWYLNHLQIPFENFQSYKIENAIKLHRVTLNLPCSTNLTQNQIKNVVRHLEWPKS